MADTPSKKKRATAKGPTMKDRLDQALAKLHNQDITLARRDERDQTLLILGQAGVFLRPGFASTTTAEVSQPKSDPVVAEVLGKVDSLAQGQKALSDKVDTIATAQSKASQSDDATKQAFRELRDGFERTVASSMKQASEVVAPQLKSVGEALTLLATEVRTMPKAPPVVAPAPASRPTAPANENQPKKSSFWTRGKAIAAAVAVALLIVGIYASWPPTSVPSRVASAFDQLTSQGFKLATLPAKNTAATQTAPTLGFGDDPKKQDVALKIEPTIDNWDKLSALDRQAVVYKSCPNGKWPDDDSSLMDNWSQVALEKFSLAEAKALTKDCNIGLIVTKAQALAKKTTPVAGMPPAASQVKSCETASVKDCGKPERVIKIDLRAPNPDNYKCDPDGTWNEAAYGKCGSDYLKKSPNR